MENKVAPLRIEISYKTIIFVVLLLIGIWLLLQVKSIIILLFLCLILVSALSKPVEWLSSRKIPRPAATLMVYVVVIAIIAFVIGIIVPPLIAQTSEFVSNLPKIISTTNEFLAFNQIPVNDVSKVISGQINQIAGNLVSISSAIISSLFFLLTLVVLSFYLLLDWKTFVRLLASPFSGEQENRVITLVSKIEKGLGFWLRSQLALSALVGVLSFIGLTILGIPFALPLALIAGIMEVIPIIGPIISAVPAILVGLTISPIMGLATGALFFIVQQLEAHLIVPMIMSKVVGLQPAAVVIALLVGAKLDGIPGAFLAIPLVIVAKIVLKDFLAQNAKQKIAE